jgi:hypothetical protein
MRPGRGLAIGLAVSITVAAGSIAAASVVSIRDADRSTGTFSPVSPTGTEARRTATTAPTPDPLDVGPSGATGPSGTTGSNPALGAPTARAGVPSSDRTGGAAVTGTPATVPPTAPAPSTTTEPDDHDDDTTTSTTEPDDD